MYIGINFFLPVNFIFKKHQFIELSLNAVIAILKTHTIKKMVTMRQVQARTDFERGTKLLVQSVDGKVVGCQFGIGGCLWLF